LRLRIIKLSMVLYPVLDPYTVFSDGDEEGTWQVSESNGIFKASTQTGGSNLGLRTWERRVCMSPMKRRVAVIQSATRGL
jgi:hypothetical protein